MQPISKIPSKFVEKFLIYPVDRELTTAKDNLD